MIHPSKFLFAQWHSRMDRSPFEVVRGEGECLCALAGIFGYIVMLRARMFRSLI